MADIKWSAFPSIGNLATGDVLVGLRAGANVRFSALTIPWTVPNGGTGLTTATAYALLAGGTTATGAFQSLATGTAGQMLQSGGAGALPSWTTATFPSSIGAVGTILRSNGTGWVATTATYPATTTINEILYSSAANTISGIVSSAGALIATDSSSIPVALANPGATGKLLSSVNGDLPQWTTLGGGLPWTTIAGTTQAAAVNNGYVIGNAAQTTVTLPATAAVGSVVAVAGQGAGGFILAANTGQTIKFAASTTTSGGSLTSGEQYDYIQVVCIVANTTWLVQSAISTGFTPA